MRHAAMLRGAAWTAGMLGLLAFAAPAQADPPHWRHGGWHKHHRWGPPPHRYYPPPMHYYGPRAYYAPPPVYYAPPPPVYMAPGLSFGFSVPLR